MSSWVVLLAYYPLYSSVTLPCLFFLVFYLIRIRPPLSHPDSTRDPTLAMSPAETGL